MDHDGCPRIFHEIPLLALRQLLKVLALGYTVDQLRDWLDLLRHAYPGASNQGALNSLEVMPRANHDTIRTVGATEVSGSGFPTMAAGHFPVEDSQPYNATATVAPHAVFGGGGSRVQRRPGTEEGMQSCQYSQHGHSYIDNAYPAPDPLREYHFTTAARPISQSERNRSPFTLTGAIQSNGLHPSPHQAQPQSPNQPYVNFITPSFGQRGT